MIADSLQKKTVVLAGNPNVGKSTLFNRLTGLHQHTGNWPGKTVQLAYGQTRYHGYELELIDLPGTYSLDGHSQDEQLAAQYLRSNQAQCVVIVCDASCLERNLILALQILRLTQNAILCVNLMDEAETMGIRVDAALLSRRLQIPVVKTSAGRNQGLDALLDQILRLPEHPPERSQPVHRDCVADAHRIASECVRQVPTPARLHRKQMDQLLVSRRFGVPLMVLLLFFIVWLTVWGANYPSALLERLFDLGYRLLQTAMKRFPAWLQGALLDGIYATSARVISVMLPPMAIFFPLFTILEDIGYLPRVAFLLDHSMERCGSCGKQALTMCMGLGCNAVGVTGCRIIDSPRERAMAALTNAMIPCNGRFPTLILLGSLFFPGVGSALIVAACVCVGIMGAMATTGILSRTVLPGHSDGFVMEIPPLRRPKVGQILVRSLLDRTFYVAGRALSVAAPAGLLLWILSSTQVLAPIAAFLNPIGNALGMNGVILLAFILSFPANELLIPAVLLILTGATGLSALTGTGEALLLDAGWDQKIALCTMVFTLFHWPCSTTLLTLKKETGSLKQTAAAFILPTAVGCLLCILIRLL